MASALLACITAGCILITAAVSGAGGAGVRAETGPGTGVGVGAETEINTGMGSSRTTTTNTHTNTRPSSSTARRTSTRTRIKLGTGLSGGGSRNKKMSYLDKTVQITELLVPRSPRAGRDVTLSCRFRLGGPDHRLYTVNWWRDRDQFYSYKDNNFEPKQAYTFRGIHVKLEESTAETVVLEGVTEETSGVFKCEVMGEGPSFRTATDTKRMTVVVPPQQLRIEYQSRTQLPRYRLGQTVYLNCTARGAKPRATLQWEVNGTPVRETSLYRYPDTREKSGRVTSTLGLRWRSPDTFRDPLARVTCRATVPGGHVTSESQVIYLDTASSVTYHHRYSSEGARPHPPWTTVSVAVLSFARTISL
ncbi:hypothetical protein O3P69_002691 [Scylla paramamosain]|uniref:Ig-like domain-containing protein n=2 Tax=Scylla paramamosain TaxID=85552 RepID=A0AAW0UPE3_SCYPA